MLDELKELLKYREPFCKEVGGDTVLVKAFNAPATYKANPEMRSAVFTMSTERPDRDGDIVRTAGIDLSEFKDNPIALSMHKSRDLPLGKWANVKRSTRDGFNALEGELQFLPEGKDADVDRVVAHIEHGTLRACSIGFIPVKWQRIMDDQDRWTGGFDIKECKLVECSVVTIPANAQALVKMTEDEQVLARETIESVLKEWTLTPAGVLMPRKDYELELAKIGVADVDPPAVKNEVDEDSLLDRLAKRLEKVFRREGPAPEFVEGSEAIAADALTKAQAVAARHSL